INPTSDGVAKRRPVAALLETVEERVEVLAQAPEGLHFESVFRAAFAAPGPGLEGVIAVEPYLHPGLAAGAELLAQLDGHGRRQGDGAFAARVVVRDDDLRALQPIHHVVA